MPWPKGKKRIISAEHRARIGASNTAARAAARAGAPTAGEQKCKECGEIKHWDIADGPSSEFPIRQRHYANGDVTRVPISVCKPCTNLIRRLKYQNDLNGTYKKKWKRGALTYYDSAPFLAWLENGEGKHVDQMISINHRKLVTKARETGRIEFGTLDMILTYIDRPYLLDEFALTVVP